MNQVVLLGRMTKDPEVRFTSSNIATCSFTVAVDRRSKEGGADFLNCVAWRQTAENIGKYFTKGQKIAVVGRLQARDYTTKDGDKRYVTEVVVDSFDFCEKGKTKDAEPAEFKPVETADDSLPF